MYDHKIEFYEQEDGKHRAFWIYGESAIEFGDRQDWGYPLDPNKYKKIEIHNVDPNLLGKIQAAGIAPNSACLTLPDLSDYYKIYRKNEKKKAVQIVYEMLSTTKNEIQDEFNLEDTKKKWPELLHAKYLWEFLRRSQKFQSDCDELQKKREYELFQTVWISGSSDGLAELFPEEISSEFLKFRFIWRIPLFRAPGTDLVFVFYKQNFRELLENLAIVALIRNEAPKKWIKKWVGEYIVTGSNSIMGFPGPLLDIKIMGPKTNSKKIGNGMQVDYEHYIECGITVDSNKTSCLLESLSRKKLQIFRMTVSYKQKLCLKR